MTLTAAARDLVERSRIVVADDVAAIRSGAHTAESLLAQFQLTSASSDWQGWAEYVAAVAGEAARS